MQRHCAWSQISDALQRPPQSAGQPQAQALFGSHTWPPGQPWSQRAPHSQAQVFALHTVPSGQPPQSKGHSQAQLLAGLQVPLPGQAELQSGPQLHSQVDWLQNAPGPQPPQSLGHSQAQMPPLHSRGPAPQAPPQSPSHSQAQVLRLHCVPTGQPPQSLGHSHWQLDVLHTCPGVQLPLQLLGHAQAQSVPQTLLGPQFASQAPRSHRHTPRPGSQAWPGAQGSPHGGAPSCQTR